MSTVGVDATIALSVRDNLSEAIVGMRNSLTAFRTDIPRLQEELDRLNATRVQMRMDLSQARREVQLAQRAFEALGDSVSEAERQAAEADWRTAEENLQNLQQQYDLVSRQVRQTTRDMENASGAIRRNENRADNGGGQQDDPPDDSPDTSGSRNLLSALGQAGMYEQLGDVVSQWANTLVTSTAGSDIGTLFSSALSGAGSGAAIGTMIAPGIGTAVGAALGGLTGLAGGASQVFESEDETFKSYYQQLYTQGQTAGEASLTSGSATAAQRELDAIAFNQLLGSGTGDTYLSDLRKLAAKTPMEYGDLTQMSQALATGFGDSPERMLELMSAIGDAGSAVGGTASDMTAMSQAMSRMQSSGKATLEYLNIFQDRGVNVIGMLSEALGKTQGEIYDMISKGEIKGQTAVDVIQAGMEAKYGGAMETMSQTFEGLTSTLSDTMAELDAARGEGYNAQRKEGLQAEADAYGGALGEAVADINRISGQNQAYLENLSEQYNREALSAVLLGDNTTPGLFTDEQTEALKEMRDEFLQASSDYESGSQEAGIKMESLQKQAEALATAAYESSDAYQSVQETELDLVSAIRENTAALGRTAWMSDYRMQQEQSKGQGYKGGPMSLLGIWNNYHDNVSQTRNQTESKSGYHAAFGLNRVPYDGYAAVLHQGERVLTAREARVQDTAGPSVSVTVTGNQFGSGSSPEEIGAAIADAVARKLAAGVR
ncbi:tape measure protein [Pseudoflavonifractor phocaeensis]|uniref:tape measure protein n=1 Tax=Pseudoflavonifractor phocaeensis TaxID=1870988 RepID=UPI00195CEDC8|nr:tape measure protein [Pseudoflavonifractor phocaeensis]